MIITITVTVEKSDDIREGWITQPLLKAVRSASGTLVSDGTVHGVHIRSDVDNES